MRAAVKPQRAAVDPTKPTYLFPQVNTDSCSSPSINLPTNYSPSFSSPKSEIFMAFSGEAPEPGEGLCLGETLLEKGSSNSKGSKEGEGLTGPEQFYPGFRPQRGPHPPSARAEEFCLGENGVPARGQHGPAQRQGKLGPPG